MKDYKTMYKHIKHLRAVLGLSPLKAPSGNPKNPQAASDDKRHSQSN